MTKYCLQKRFNVGKTENKSFVVYVARFARLATADDVLEFSFS